MYLVVYHTSALVFLLFFRLLLLAPDAAVHFLDLAQG